MMQHAYVYVLCIYVYIATPWPEYQTDTPTDW